jgi:hypothetical protein
MSALLDQLAFLDPDRRRECEANDAALEASLMRHGTCSASRALAAQAAAAPVPVELDLDITVRRAGEPPEHIHGHFGSRIEAHLFVMEQYGRNVSWELAPGGAS